MNKPSNSGDAIVVNVDSDMKELIPMFMNQRKLDIESLRHAIAQHDYESIRKTGHSLAGTGSSFGFQPVSDIGATLEAAAKSREDALIAQGLSDLEAYMSRVVVKYV